MNPDASPTWSQLVTDLRGLPGVGPKMAERLALHLLRRPAAAEALLGDLARALERLKRCPRCGDFVEAEEEPAPDCARCLDGRRDAGLLCVVEEIGDLQAIEKSRAFQGRYHVLGGALSPLDGVGPDELRIDSLLDRLRGEGVREVILATNPTAEGETTAAYIADLARDAGVAVTRLAYGLPSGAAIQYADEYTLAQAIDGRRAI